MRLVRRRSPSNEGALAAPPTDGLPAAPVDPELQRAFVETYERVYPRLIDHAARLFGRDRESAKDAAAAAVARAWIRWPWLRPEQRTEHYFFTAVKNEERETLALNARFVGLEDAETQLEKLADRDTVVPTRHDTADDILDLAIARMPRRRREVFLLIKQEDYTYLEVAQMLGLSLGTINTHMRLATNDVRDALARAGIRTADVEPARLPAPKGDAIND